jgi:hypothetical protein
MHKVTVHFIIVRSIWILIIRLRMISQYGLTSFKVVLEMPDTGEMRQILLPLDLREHVLCCNNCIDVTRYSYVFSFVGFNDFYFAVFHCLLFSIHSLKAFTVDRYLRMYE